LHWREHTLTAKDTNADMYQALTRCIDKIEKQAVKLKKKIIERKQSATPLSALSPEPAAENAAPETGARQPRIIAARRYRVKPMTAEEAAMTLAEDSNQFVVFRDSDTSRLSVLYKRKDGNFGLIQP
jgi:putative sigma-54 modulation protein